MLPKCIVRRCGAPGSDSTPRAHQHYPCDRADLGFRLGPRCSLRAQGALRLLCAPPATLPAPPPHVLLVRLARCTLPAGARRG